ncbi:tetratricopeptide repeat protein [Myxococcus landrumensis]|uniref:Tetratricopeptide repeat protein n=1 Tax=Myxococcus landrumensis TaxID=2813577 RepID=A0ABX7NG88_9BACT|nr:tetratricopeptide repeat protein [Myxococcus landrumus]QSQ17394.1 tetratricopeptide repeat protein [Myxococcus landrumus]
MNVSLRALALVLSLAGSTSASAAEPPPALTQQELERNLSSVEQQLRTAEEALRFVETQYSQRPEPDEAQVRARRYSDAEIHYLLGDWNAASVLFYDLVSDPAFHSHPRYPDALFFLADALYQQKNDLGARIYLRELLALPSPSARHRDALTRYLGICGKLNLFDGIEAQLEQARGLYGGQLPPDIQYVNAKWLFRRTDLPPAERMARARAAFAPLAQVPGGPYQLQAGYHMAVLSMQAGELPLAILQFQQLLVPVPQQGASPATADKPVVRTTADTDPARIRELSLMSLGRLLYEAGRFDEALDRYGQVPRESESFPESLYEIAWTQVRKGNHQEAKNAVDILLMVSPDSRLAPEAKLLQGHLLQKLQKYNDAIAAYDELISTFRPVREKVDGMLSANRDPVAYFDRLLARTDTVPDVRTLLPPLALRYASTERDVGDAVKMVGDIDTGKKGTVDARELAARILLALQTRRLETFPELQEGFMRADAVETAVANAEAALVELERHSLESSLTATEREKLLPLRHERETLAARFATLPTTQKELEERLRRMQARVDSVDREAFRLGAEVRGLHAIAAAVRKWVDDTRLIRQTPPDEEREFLVQLQAEVKTLQELQLELDKTRGRLADERNSAAASLAGEQAIRGRYLTALRAEHDVLSEAERRQSPSSLLTRAHQARDQGLALSKRVSEAQSALLARVDQRGRRIREKVLAEQKLLDKYEAEVAAVSSNARQLVGRIAYESFRRVRRQFYDLVLKADVGVVDVAFTEKQDKTTAIQKVSAQKAEALRALDADFRGVLAEDGR